MSAEPVSIGPLDIRPGEFDWAQFGRVVEGAPWRGRSVIITGGMGFIGARLARKLVTLGASVTIPTRVRHRGGTQVDPNIRLVAWNPSDPNSILATFAQADTLFNLAYDVRRLGEANLALYRGIADAAAATGVRRFVHASSIAVYDGWCTEDLDENSPSDGPGSIYKMAKRAMEQDLEARTARGEFDAVIIQPVNVYGPFSRMWTDAIVERIRACGIALPAGFDELNNCVYVDDLVDAFIAAGDLTYGGARRFIVAGPGPIPWADMFAAYVEGCGGDVEHEDWQPASEVLEHAPGLADALKRRLDGLVMWASAYLADRIGTSKVSALRARLAKLRGASSGGPYRPVQEDPRLYLSRAVVDASRAAAELCPPVVGAAEGLARTKAYIAWRYRSPEG